MATYYGILSDFAGRPFPGAVPRLEVTTDRDAVGPSGLLSRRPVPIPTASDGTFMVNLIESARTSPSVRYIFRCTWLTTTSDGVEVESGWSEWTITAAIGGGPVKDMVSAPVAVWFVGPPWPESPTPGAFYLNRNGNQPWARYPG